MSNVNPPSDGGYQYYQKTVSELEEDLKAQTDRAKKAAADRADEAERKYKRDLARTQDSYERTTDRIREDGRKASNADRERSREELSRFKEETYDRFGKMSTQERADHLAKQKALAEDFEASRRKQQTDLNDLRASHQQKSREMSARNDEKLQRTVQNLQGDAKSTIAQDNLRNREAFEQLKKDTRRSQEGLERQKQAELTDDKARYRSGLNEMSNAYASRQRSADEAMETRQEKYNRAADARSETAIRRGNESHAQEMREVSALMKEQSTKLEDYPRGQAEGYRDATREYENEWRSKLQHQGESYESQLDSWKSKIKQSEESKDAAYNQRLREKDRFYTEVIRRRDGDSHVDRKHLESEITRNQADFSRQSQATRERNERHAESRAVEQAARTQDLLETQAQNFRDSMSRQRDTDQERIGNLSRELQRRSTSTDAADISPAVEEIIRKQYYAEEAKTRQTDQERTRDAIDSTQKDYSRRLHETVLDKETALTNHTRNHTLERDRDRRDFLNFAHETEANHEDGQRRLRSDNDRNVENLTKTYASVLDKQKREGDLASLNQRADADTRLSELRQKADFDAKMAQRTFNNQQNELTREYDRKLADQESEHARQMAELKDTTAKRLREAETDAKRAIDQMSRSYEQRQAQTEMQHKERERIITQNYEDQLDKVKRKNELLISKKG